jgi:hypothetical protein
MTTAVFASAGDVRAPSKLSLLAKGVIHALAESRARDALRELHRHEIFLKDLGRRQDHSRLFSTQADSLPVKI